jgi:arsenate reductase
LTLRRSVSYRQTLWDGAGDTGDVNLVLYGIRNCDSVAAARRWLEARDLGFQFHDYRAGGLDPERLKSWVREVGIDTVLNRKGAAYRKLDPIMRAAFSEDQAIAAMMGDLLLIKRPVLEGAASLLVGFSPADYERVLLAPPSP